MPAVAFWSTKKQMRSGNIAESKPEQTLSTIFKEESCENRAFMGWQESPVVIIILSAWYYYVGTRKIPSTGGLYFFSKLVLPVQRFAQGDPRWADDELGPAPSTMGEEGCAVSSAAMVLAFYGQDVDPGRLNAFLFQQRRL